MRKASAFLLAAWLFAACGYRVLARGPVFGAATIAIMPFTEAGASDLQGPLMQALHRTLDAEGLTLVSDAALADAVMTGSISVRDLSTQTLQQVDLYSLNVVVTAQLWGPGRTPLWQEALSLEDDYLPTDPLVDVEPLVTERRRRVVLFRLATEAAQKMAHSLREAAFSGETETCLPTGNL